MECTKRCLDIHCSQRMNPTDFGDNDFLFYSHEMVKNLFQTSLIIYCMLILLAIYYGTTVSDPNHLLIFCDCALLNIRTSHIDMVINAFCVVFGTEIL